MYILLCLVCFIHIHICKIHSYDCLHVAIIHSFSLLHTIHCVSITINSTFDEYLYSFKFRDILYNAVMNILIYLSWCKHTHISLGCLSKSENLQLHEYEQI